LTAEFYDPNEQKPGNVIKLYVLTDKLPQLLGYKPNSTGEELAVAFHRRISSFLSNPPEIRIIKIKRDQIGQKRRYLC